MSRTRKAVRWFVGCAFALAISLTNGSGQCASPNVDGVINPVANVTVRNIVNDAPVAGAQVVFDMCDINHVDDGVTDARGLVRLGYYRNGPSTRIQCYVWNVRVSAVGFSERQERREDGARSQDFTIYLEPVGGRSGRREDGSREHRNRRDDESRGGVERYGDRPYFEGDGTYLYLPVLYQSDKEYVVREDRTGPMPVTQFTAEKSARITLSRYGGGKHGVWVNFPGFSCGLTNHQFDLPDNVVRERRRVVSRGNIGAQANRNDCPRLSYEIVGDTSFSEGKVELYVRGVTIYGEE